MPRPAPHPKPAPQQPVARRQLRTRRDRVYPNRINEIVAEVGMTHATLAAAIEPPAHELTITKLATGKMKLTHDWMKRIAAATGREPQDLIARSVAPGLRRVRVKGTLCAGSWIEAFEWPEDDHYDVLIPNAPELRDLELYGGVIAGDSMNLRYPPKTVVVLSRIRQRPGEIAMNRRYHVRLTRPDGRTEETIKMLVEDAERRLWLKPESSSPDHQAWIPLDGAGDAVVELIGRVRFAVRPED